MENPKVATVYTEDFIPVKTISTKFGDLLLYCVGRGCLYRADTFFTKEPETLAWVDTFEEGDTMWDIGANIGLYGLYAALRPIKVMSFEPSAFNFFTLTKNIQINGFDKSTNGRDQRMSALCLAFSNSNALASFNMNLLGVGDSNHQLVGYNDQSTAGFKQATLTLTIDDFVRNFNPPFPTHIKIDVDGVESEIIQGGMKTFSDLRVKSVLIEIDDNNPADGTIIRMLNFAGLEMVSRDPAAKFYVNSLYNCVFRRK